MDWEVVKVGVFEEGDSIGKSMQSKWTRQVDFLLFGDLGWVTIKHFVTTSGVKGLYKMRWI
jgi:hypothetical protein